MINKNNTVFFSTANDDYVYYAAVSLLTVRDYIEDADLYLLSSKLSNEKRHFLESKGIKYLELDLTNRFTRSWDYPIECYYIFAGPEVFLEKGYKYSVYIDGDILCQKNPLEGLGAIPGVAGVRPGSQPSNEIFGDDWSTLSSLWEFESNIELKKRIHSGVVYFNNNRMAEIGLLNTVSNLFIKCLESNVPRKGDDSLFSLFQLLYLAEGEIKILPPTYNYMLQYNEWIYPVPQLVFFHFSLDKPWKENPYQHEHPDLNKCNEYVRLWLSSFDEQVSKVYTRSNGQKFILDKIGRELRSTLLGLRMNYLQRKINTRKSPVRTYWWRSDTSDIFNFGDEITKDIIPYIYGLRVERVGIEECELIGAGSILQSAFYRQNSETLYIWGSGFINDGDYGTVENARYLAVRGSLTRQKSQVECALGDPGILASIVYQRAKHKIGKIGVVIHYAEHELEVVDKLSKDDRFLIINPLNSPESVAEDISSCKAVISSSLHGIIFADSYGVPNVHVEFSDKVIGDGYKFKDYYSSVGRNYETLLEKDVFQDGIADLIHMRYQPINIRRSQRALIKAFKKP